MKKKSVTSTRGSTARKRKEQIRKIFLVGLWWVFLLVLTCYLCGHLSSVILAGTTSEQLPMDLWEHIKAHPFSDLSFHGLTWYCGILVWLTIIVWPYAFKRKMPVEDQVDITHLIETGSPELLDTQERLTSPQLPFDDKHPLGKGNLGRETNMLLSQNVKLTYNTWQTRLGTQNVLCIGGSGEGKSRYLVRPNVYSLPTDPRTGRPMSMVFTDPKGELCADLGGFLKDNGYEIRVFNVVDMQYSSCYNPFRYIRDAESLMIMVDAVVEEAILGFIHYYQISLPPIYEWENGYLCGTHPWPARQWTGSLANAWREIYEIDPGIVREAAKEIESAKEYLKIFDCK